MYLLPVHLMMPAVQAWARERLGPDPHTKAEVAAVPWGELAWRLPWDGRSAWVGLVKAGICAMRPEDPYDAYIALPVRVVRFMYEEVSDEQTE